MFGAYGQETGGMVQCIGMEKKGAVPRRNGVKMEQRKMKKVTHVKDRGKSAKVLRLN